jgi:hypothetical protein
VAKMKATPTDELTKLPLPILPIENPVKPDWHHHFHPRNSPRLTSKMGGPALRAARLQRVDYGAHHDGYHNLYTGPPLPKKLKDRFGLIVMSVAGYMPDQALDFSGDAPAIVPLSEEKRLFLQTSGQIRTGNHTAIRNFIRDYVMSQDVGSTNIGELTIEEFIYTRDEDRRRMLGHTLLGLITDKATEPLNEQYYQAKKQRKISPDLPHSAMRFTKALLGPPRSRDMLVDQLHARLEARLA